MPKALFPALAACAGALIGSWFATPWRDAAPAGAAPGDPVLTELRALRLEVVAMRHAPPVAPSGGQATPLPREVVATAPSSPDAGLVTRLEEIVRRLAAVEVSAGSSELTQARTQNPQPNLAATEVLWKRLTDARNADDADGRRAVARELWLCSAAEVVRRLGTPSNVAPQGGGRIMWEYILDKQRSVTVILQDGVVVSVSD